MVEEQRGHGEPVAEGPIEPEADAGQPGSQGWLKVAAVCLLVVMIAGVGYLMHDTVAAWEQKPAPMPPVAYVPSSGQVVQADQLKATQDTNGKRIMAAGMRMGMGRKAIVAALVTSMHRTSMLNMATQTVVQTRQYRYDYTWNRPGVGLFGETRRDLWVQMNPSLAAEAFFRELRGVEDWRLMTVPQIAQYMQPDSGYESTVDAAEDFYVQNAEEVDDAVHADQRDPLPLTSGRTRTPSDDPFGSDAKMPYPSRNLEDGPRAPGDIFGSDTESPYPSKKLEDGPRVPTRVAGVPR